MPSARPKPDSERVARRAEERIATWGLVTGAVARLQVVEEQLAAYRDVVGLHHLLTRARLVATCDAGSPSHAFQSS